MSPRVRLVLFALAALLLLPAALRVVTRMPAFGAHPLPYGDAINAAAPRERHVQNAISAVNFDYRGFDTLGEEFMLLTAVTGAVLLLRGGRGEERSARPGPVEGRRIAARSDATVLLGRASIPLVLVFGAYMALHATVTPGGGFQGGVVMATGLLLAFVSEGYRGWRTLVPFLVLAMCEAGGCAVFALAGFAPLLAGAAFLQNVLPLGQAGDMLSGGLMQVINGAVAFAVAGGFTVLFIEFLEETRAIREQDGGGP